MDAPGPPRSLTAAWIVGGLATAWLLVEAAGGQARATGSGYVVYLLMAAAVEGACLVGLALRQRWGLLGYGSFFLLHQLILGAAGAWSAPGFLARAAVLVLASFNVRHLR